MSDYMQAAAEKAIRDLQAQVNNAQEAADAAKKSADSVANSAKRWKILTLVLGFFVAVVLAVAGFGVSLYAAQNNATNTLRRQAVNSCMIGNDRARGTVIALDELVTLLEGPHPTAQVQQEAKTYEAFVLRNNAARDCNQAYGS